MNWVNAKVDDFDRSQSMFSRCSGKTLTKMAVALCSLAKLREVVSLLSQSAEATSCNSLAQMFDRTALAFLLEI